MLMVLIAKLETVQFEELVQVAVLEVLEHDAERLVRRANSQNARQMRVVESSQQSHLLVESRSVSHNKRKVIYYFLVVFFFSFVRVHCTVYICVVVACIG